MMCVVEEGYQQVAVREQTPLESTESQPDPKTTCLGLVCSRECVKALLLGQFVSLLLCGTAVSTGLLQEQGVNIPTAQSFFNYVLLALVFGTVLAFRSRERTLLQCLKQWWWRYLLIALVDVEANYLVVKAYAYTTVTSVQLLDCSSVITVFILSYIFLRAGYKLLHLGGAGVCLIGMLGLVLTDILVGKNSNSASNVALGDVLIIVGASLYGVSNVCEEYVVRHFDKIEFLGMVGLFGSFINGAQLAILERNEIANLDLASYKTGWFPHIVKNSEYDQEIPQLQTADNPTAPQGRVKVCYVVPLVVFVVCLFLLYSTMTVVIQMTSATIVNLSILSADFYTLLFGLFLFNYKFHFLYFLSFGVILCGLAIYSIKPVTVRVRNADTSATAEEEIHVHKDQVNFKSVDDIETAGGDVSSIAEGDIASVNVGEKSEGNITSAVALT